MPPKKTGSTKKSGSGVTHPSYADMIKDAILNLKERNGSSRQAIKKYIKANNNLGETTDAAFTSHVNRALAAGEKSGDFSRPKGPSGPVKLAKKDAKKESKAAAKPKAPKTATKEKKPAAPKEKKAAAPKKATEKKPAAAPKKAAAKPNASKPRSKKATASTSAAPAVEDKPTVLGKTKSGRVTKTKATGTKETKKPAAKKATTKKAAAEKKAPTPKKSEEKTEAAA